MPKHVDTFLVWMALEFGWPARDIAAAVGERVETLVHLLAVHGCPDLSVRLAKEALTR